MDPNINPSQMDSRMAKKRMLPGTEDAEMDGEEQPGTAMQSQDPVRERKKIKAKRRNDGNNQEKIYDENGQEISFEDESDDMDDGEYIDDRVEENVMKVGSSDGEDWEDMDDEESMAIDDDGGSKQTQGDKTTKKEEESQDQKEKVWNEENQPLKVDEELDFDSSAYEMLHRSEVEWPCLTLDVIVRERCPEAGTPFGFKDWFGKSSLNQLTDESSHMNEKLGIREHKQDKYPMSVYFCGGSQSVNKGENKIYVMKWSEMVKTLHDDDMPADNSEDDEEDMINKQNQIPPEPVIRFESIPHRGAVNRLRTLCGSPIVATWSDEGEVGIYNIQSAINDLDAPVDPLVLQSTTSIGKKKKKKNIPKKNYGGTKIGQFRHKSEGFALEWSPLNCGRLASGSCDAQLWIYGPADENCSSFVKETQGSLQGHKDSIEDIQWSPSQENVLATCSVDRTIKLWDLRATKMKSQMSFLAHDCDVNVMSWNTQTKFLLASGDDKGEFKIWDLRMLGSGGQGGKSELDAITKIRWHTQSITSLQFEPREESVLAVASADNKLTLWDFSVEMDEQELEEHKKQVADSGFDIPPQLLFLHQGQKNMKELRFHPEYRTLLLTTAQDSFNVFRPNLDPDFEPEDQPEIQIGPGLQKIEEEKQGSDDEDNTTETSKKVPGKKIEYNHDDEDMEDEERRIMATARQLNKQRRARSKSLKKGNKRKKI